MGASLRCLYTENCTSKRYIKVGAEIPVDAYNRSQAQRQRLYLFDLEALKVVEDHNGVRRLLKYVSGWVEQVPRDGFLEYWFYFSHDHERKFPAAKARLPWPLFLNAPTPMLQAFVHVVNRVAHRPLLSIIPASDFEAHHWLRRKRDTYKKKYKKYGPTPAECKSISRFYYRS